MAEEIIYYGEGLCSAILLSGASCRNKAYFRLPSGEAVCGVHNKGKAGAPLPKNPRSEERAKAEQGEREAAIEQARRANAKAGKKGTVLLDRLRMMKVPERQAGFVAVFPNCRAGNSRSLSTFNCRELSPMVIGPVEHGQPGLPPARCLENFHQGNKCFKSEVDEHGNPLPAWYERRLTMYRDPVPHRHKLGKSKAEHLRNAGGKPGDNANAALYSIFVRADGSEERCPYVESRKYYCRFYEAGALRTPAFADLSRLLGKGYNLQIFDPDGCPMSSEIEDLASAVKRAYSDESQPFGHGKVLFAMLALPRASWPWVA